MNKKLILIFPLLLLLLAGCSSPDTPTPEPTIEPTIEAITEPTTAPLPTAVLPTDEPKLTVLHLGDSYTVGESVAIEESWPYQLGAILYQNGFKNALPDVVGRTGWTTSDLIRGIEHTQLTPPYDLVTLQIGVNNQYRGREIDEYEQEFEALLQTSIELAGGDPTKVIVVNIPDWAAMPFAAERTLDEILTISAEIDAFNVVNLTLSEKYGVHHVDIVDISRAAFEYPPYVAADTLHPSGEQYAAWVAEILPIAAEILFVE
jgi:lysophospholipase L1-like esterase